MKRTSAQVSDCRFLAAQVIAAVIQQQGSLATLLPKALAQAKEKDHALLQELCYGTLRYFYSLDFLISQCLTKPLREKDSDIRALLLIGLYQLLHTRIPSYAAINSAVSAAGNFKKAWAKALINAVLRKIQRDTTEATTPIFQEDVYRFDHPQWLIDMIRCAWPSQADDILSANNSRAPMTLRVNERQFQRDDYLRLLQEQSIAAQKTLFSNVGIQLETPTAVENLPGFYAGSVSIQDEAAQLCAKLMKIETGQHVLDACAAPGGKACHLLEQSSNISLVAIDVDIERSALIRENLQRLNLEAKVITADAIQPELWWHHHCNEKKFDRILIDAPCSATGVIRHHPDIKLLRRANDVPQLASTQLRLLRALWPLLTTNGCLLYVTCSVLPQENDEIIQKFLQQNPDAQQDPMDENWGINTHYGKQLLPVVNGHDGFYFARLKKI